MNKILGLAYRARKVVFGTESTINNLRTNKVKLILLANDASDNTKKKVYDKCKYYNVNVIELLNSKEMSNSIGKKSNIMVIGITDQGFSNLLLNQKKDVKEYGQKTKSNKQRKKRECKGL